MERTGAVILAAGLSSRMHEFKPLLELGDSTIIVRAIENLKTAGASPVSYTHLDVYKRQGQGGGH